jgi:hypothetical protein
MKYQGGSTGRVPKRDGAARLLKELVRTGLSPDAIKPAASLCLTLDEMARSAGMRHIGHVIREYLEDAA